MSVIKEEKVEKVVCSPTLSSAFKTPQNNSKAMHYSVRNKAFIQALSKKAISNSMPIACNPNSSLLHLAYKLRVAEKAMYGNRPNAVAGIIPIPPSAYKNSFTGPMVPKPLKRSYDTMVSGDIHTNNNQNFLWPVLIGAKGTDELEIDEQALAKYSVRPGVSMNGERGEILAQPLSSSEMKNIMDCAINCVIDSKRKSSNKGPISNATSKPMNINSKKEPFYEIVQAGPSRTPPPSIPALAGSIHKYRCPMCEYETDNRSHLRRHQSSVHRINVPYFCYICKREFARVEKVKYHFERVHPEVTYDPKIVRKENYDEDVPNASFADGSDSEIEETGLDMTVDEEDYTAEGTASPTKSFTPQPERTIIPTKAPPQSYRCPQCSYLARDVWHLRRHIAECHSTNRRFRCSQCQYATNRRHNMVSHVKLHDKLVCIYSHCDQVCKDWQEFSEHLNKCGEKPDPVQSTNNYNCKHCDSRMPNRSVLAKHLLKQHNVILHCCLYCTFTTTEPDEYSHHLATHSTKTTIQCEHCKETFDSKAVLEDHVLAMHSKPTLPSSDQELMTCSICQYQTRHRAIMNSHLRSRHQMTGTRQCSYPGCSFTAQSQEALVRHYTRCHEQPLILNAKGIFPCPVCTDRPPFKYRKSFEKHMDTHKKEERCPLCEEAFYTFGLLKKHIEGDHEAEVEEVTDSEDEGIDTTQEEQDGDVILIKEEGMSGKKTASPAKQDAAVKSSKPQDLSMQPQCVGEKIEVTNTEQIGNNLHGEDIKGKVSSALPETHDSDSQCGSCLEEGRSDGMGCDHSYAAAV